MQKEALNVVVHYEHIRHLSVVFQDLQVFNVQIVLHRVKALLDWKNMVEPDGIVDFLS